MITDSRDAVVMSDMVCGAEPDQVNHLMDGQVRTSCTLVHSYLKTTCTYIREHTDRAFESDCAEIRYLPSHYSCIHNISIAPGKMAHAFASILLKGLPI